MPPYPIRIQSEKNNESTRTANLLRNYMGVNNEELKRLRGDLSAYRDQERSGKTVAFPKQKVIYTPNVPFTKDIEEEIQDADEVDKQEVEAKVKYDKLSGMKLSQTLSEYTSSESDTRPGSPMTSPPSSEYETDSGWRDKLALRPNSPLSSPPSSDNFQSVNELSPTDVSDFDTAQSGASGDRRRRVAFKDTLDISILPPRRNTRKQKNMAEIKRELQSLGIHYGSTIKKTQLHELATNNSISISR